MPLAYTIRYRQDPKLGPGYLKFYANNNWMFTHNIYPGRELYFLVPIFEKDINYPIIVKHNGEYYDELTTLNFDK